MEDTKRDVKSVRLGRCHRIDLLYIAIEVFGKTDIGIPNPVQIVKRHKHETHGLAGGHPGVVGRQRCPGFINHAQQHEVRKHRAHENHDQYVLLTAGAAFEGEGEPKQASDDGCDYIPPYGNPLRWRWHHLRLRFHGRNQWSGIWLEWNRSWPLSFDPLEGAG